jgi:DNA-binding SARP family transcriptional activator
MPNLAVQLLGPPIIARDREPLVFPTRKALALLAYLTLESSPHARSTLATLFWPTSSQPDAHGALRYSLHILKQVIGAQWLVSDRWTIGLQQSQDVTCDVALFYAYLQSTTIHGHPSSATCWRCRQPLEQALALYRADFMQGFTLGDSPQFDEWQRSYYVNLRDALASVLDRLVQLDMAQSAWDQAVTHARSRLALDPMHEPAHHQLMCIYTWAGRRTAALGQYRACVDLLDKELGLPPSAETQALLHAIDARQLTSPAATPYQLPPTSPTAAPAASPSAPAHYGAPHAFVGRESELDRLHGWLWQVAGGSGQICFVVGEAGSGKSALLQAFALSASAGADIQLVATNCTAYTGAGDPLQPFRDLLMQLLAQPVPALLDILLSEGPDLLASVLPASTLAESQPLWTNADAAAQERLRAILGRREVASPEVDTQLQLYDQFTAVLQTLATQSTLLVLIDDLQWADPSSLHLLFHLGRRIATARLMLVGTYRPDDLKAGRIVEGHWIPHPLTGIVDELHRYHGDILVDLDRANAVGSRAFVDALLNQEPNHLGDRFRAELYRRTEGQPLFTVELLQELQANGSLLRDTEGYWVAQSTLSWHALPDRIEALLAGQLGRMDEALREVLRIASIEGGTFTVEVVARVQGSDNLAVLQLLVPDPARSCSFVQPDNVDHVNGKRITRYRFRHFLLQQYVYSQVSAGEKAYIHEEVGAALEELYGSATDRVAVQLAYHFQMAGNTPKAIHYLTQAGQRTLRLAAFEEALQHLQQARSLLLGLPSASDNTSEHMLLELPLQMTLGVAYTAYHGYGAAEGGQAFVRAAQLSRQLEGTPYLGQIVRG